MVPPFWNYSSQQQNVYITAKCGQRGDLRCQFKRRVQRTEDQTNNDSKCFWLPSVKWRSWRTEINCRRFMWWLHKLKQSGSVHVSLKMWKNSPHSSLKYGKVYMPPSPRRPHWSWLPPHRALRQWSRFHVSLVWWISAEWLVDTTVMKGFMRSCRSYWTIQAY